MLILRFPIHVLPLFPFRYDKYRSYKGKEDQEEDGMGPSYHLV